MKIGVILAGGKSSRFKSSIPKGLHKIDGKSLVERLLDIFDVSKVEKKYIIVNNDNYFYYKDIKGVDFLFQGDIKGTGGALYCINGLFNDSDELIVVNSDCFLFDKTLVGDFYNKFINSDKDLGLVTLKVDDPSGYGRIYNENNKLVIIEDSDTNEITKKINIVNSGIYIFKGKYLKNNIKYLNVKYGESKITLLLDNSDCFIYCSDSLIMNINSKEDFYNVNKQFYLFNCYKHIKKGVKIYDISSTYIGEDVILGKDVEIYPNNYLLGKVEIGDNSTILPNCLIENSIIGKECKIGPFSNIKENNVIGDGAVIGAFVEVKNSNIGNKTKAKHHVYLGDAIIGENGNIGCGTITANYDGKKKYKTVIGKNSFIGSNVTLVAPVKIGDNVVIGAGSTINEDVSDNSLAIARERQVIKKDYYKKRLWKNVGKIE